MIAPVTTLSFDTDHNMVIPLLVSLRERKVAITLRPGLLSDGAPAIRDWTRDVGKCGFAGLAISEFLLFRDLPDAHRIIARALN